MDTSDPRQMAGPWAVIALDYALAEASVADEAVIPAVGKIGGSTDAREMAYDGYVIGVQQQCETGISATFKVYVEGVKTGAAITAATASATKLGANAVAFSAGDSLAPIVDSLSTAKDVHITFICLVNLEQ